MMFFLAHRQRFQGSMHSSFFERGRVYRFNSFDEGGGFDRVLYNVNDAVTLQKEGGESPQTQFSERFLQTTFPSLRPPDSIDNTISKNKIYYDVGFEGFMDRYKQDMGLLSFFGDKKYIKASDANKQEKRQEIALRLRESGIQIEETQNNDNYFKEVEGFCSHGYTITNEIRNAMLGEFERIRIFFEQKPEYVPEAAEDSFLQFSNAFESCSFDVGVKKILAPGFPVFVNDKTKVPSYAFLNNKEEIDHDTVETEAKKLSEVYTHCVKDMDHALFVFTRFIEWAEENGCTKISDGKEVFDDKAFFQRIQDREEYKNLEYSFDGLITHIAKDQEYLVHARNTERRQTHIEAELTHLKREMEGVNKQGGAFGEITLTLAELSELAQKISHQSENKEEMSASLHKGITSLNESFAYYSTIYNEYFSPDSTVVSEDIQEFKEALKKYREDMAKFHTELQGVLRTNILPDATRSFHWVSLRSVVSILKKRWEMYKDGKKAESEFKQIEQDLRTAEASKNPELIAAARAKYKEKLKEKIDGEKYAEQDPHDLLENLRSFPAVQDEFHRMKFKALLDAVYKKGILYLDDPSVLERLSKLTGVWYSGPSIRRYPSEKTAFLQKALHVFGPHVYNEYSGNMRVSIEQSGTLFKNWAMQSLPSGEKILIEQIKEVMVKQKEKGALTDSMQMRLQDPKAGPCIYEKNSSNVNDPLRTYAMIRAMLEDNTSPEKILFYVTRLTVLGHIQNPAEFLSGIEAKGKHPLYAFYIKRVAMEGMPFLYSLDSLMVGSDLESPTQYTNADSERALRALTQVGFQLLSDIGKSWPQQLGSVDIHDNLVHTMAPYLSPNGVQSLFAARGSRYSPDSKVVYSIPKIANIVTGYGTYFSTVPTIHPESVDRIFDAIKSYLYYREYVRGGDGVHDIRLERFRPAVSKNGLMVKDYIDNMDQFLRETFSSLALTNKDFYQYIFSEKVSKNGISRAVADFESVMISEDRRKFFLGALATAQKEKRFHTVFSQANSAFAHVNTSKAA